MFMCEKRDWQTHTRSLLLWIILQSMKIELTVPPSANHEESRTLQNSKREEIGKKISNILFFSFQLKIFWSSFTIGTIGYNGNNLLLLSNISNRFVI